MEINIPKDSITSLFDKLSKKIFTEDCTAKHKGPFKVQFNKKICSRLRNVMFEGFLSRRIDEDFRRGLVEEEHQFNVKEKLSIVGYKLRARGLASKAKRLEKLVSKLDFSPTSQSVYTGQLNDLCEVESVVKILLALSNEAKMLTADPCEVWRKVDACYQISLTDQTTLDSGIVDSKININYEYFPRRVFECSPTFGIPKRGFEGDNDSLQLDIFSQEPGSCGLTEWFGAKTNDVFSESTRNTLFSALIHSRASNMAVKLEIPELSSQQDFWLKPEQSSQITEDEGFEDDCRLSNLSTTSLDSGIHELEIWDKALKMKPMRFYTWEGRKKTISKSCKPYLTEAGPEIIDYLCDMRMAEASFLIDSQPEPTKYLEMSEFIRDILMVLIGVPSQTFQLEKSSGSFHVSTTVRLHGCSPESFQLTLKELAEMGTNYFRLNKFTTCQRHSTLIRSNVLRAFIMGLRAYLQKYRQSVITVQASRVQSVLELSKQFRKQSYELKFLSDVCMCSQGFAAEFGKPKPKFPVGAKLLSYLYELCLRNVNSTVANLLLFLLKVSCAPYLRFIQQWVFKGKCIDLYKEFMIFENDVYLAHRDKHYWTNGYVMSGSDNMEGVPIFLKELSQDMFICGKSINLLKLCSPEHYICNHEIKMPVMAVVYSLSSLQRISDSSRRYAEEMRKLQENIQLEWKRKKDEELHKQEQLVMSERQKANKALAEIQELVKKAKEVLAEKKREELNFLKQQMEDAINRKILESKQAAEDDARIARTSLRYEVTTAKVDDQIAEQARQELIHYYEKLTRVAERREQHAIWLAKRHALKNDRDTFLEKEKDNLDQMRNGITNEMKTKKAHETTSTRQKWATTAESWAGVRNELSSDNPTPPTVQDLIYNSDNALDSQSRNLPRIGQAMQSTAQELMYPTSRDIVSSTARSDDGDIQVSDTRDGLRGDIKMSRATDSTVQDLMYPTSKQGVEDLHGDRTVSLSTTSCGAHNVDGRTMTRATDSTVQNLMYPTSKQEVQAGTDRQGNPDLSLLRTSTDVGGKTVSRATDSIVQNLLYRSDEELVYPRTSSLASGSGKRAAGKTLTRAMDSTAQNLMYHSSEEEMVAHRSTRGVGNAFQSTIQRHMYGDRDNDDQVISNRKFEPVGVMKNVLYEHDVNEDTRITTSRGSEQPSVMKDILYPGADTSRSSVISTRGREPSGTVKGILYPHDAGQGMPRSTRGSAPPTTIQNLIYRSESVTEEPEQPKRQPLTHEDVWLASQFEPLPDNFDILDEEPFGDIFARIQLEHPGALNSYEPGGERLVDENLDDENDACNVLCLPVILQRCVMEPLTTQIKVVNSAVVRYFMDNLMLVEHFETLKKFLLMEDGEFSYSLTQQLFEKISSGASPQQLCCISTLNSIMAQSIQSSVYACHSENTRSLSFVLKSIPDIFKRNDVKVLDFIELRYKIQWPVNIIITENCITKYNRIFAFMLQLKRTAWILREIRYSLKRMDKSAGNSPQLRKLHLFRHEMSHLVNDVQGYISNQILHVSWQEFMNSLEHNVRNLDDLHDCHADYLNKSLFRALLNKKAAPVMKIISDLFTNVLKFHTQLVSSSWHVDRSSSHVIHPGFSLLCTTYESFKESTYFLLTIINKLVSRGYQPHLEELLLRLNFNSHYDKNLSSQNTHVHRFEV